MRVSIVNCVSTAERMMRFSDESLFHNSGHEEFDYVVVKWLASPEVEEYLSELPVIAKDRCPRCYVHIVEHQTIESIGFVPNLRAMMNLGFEKGFQLNSYAGLVNTDCYFGNDWLYNLVKYARPDLVVNSLHITASTPPHPISGIITENLGIPEPETFRLQQFNALYEKHFQGRLLLASKLNTPRGYRECATMPYLFHRNYWSKCGPWELTCVQGQPPDVRFFNRVSEAGADYGLSQGSIVYHHEAVERRGKRPKGAENLLEE